MALVLVFGAVAALIAMLLFNSGMLANAKTRLQNAADAGAYSAALLQARDHNFAAYTNRSIVANQVAVVQMISLKSYLEDAADTRDRIDGLVLDLQASIYPTSKPDWNRGKSAPIRQVDAAFSAVAPVAVSGLGRLIRAHETAQHAHQAATILDMALVADEVVTRNDPAAELTNGAFRLGRTNVQIVKWGNATVRHRANDPSPEADRFADVVVSEQSTDRFSRVRPSSPLPRWSSTSKPCRMLPNHVSSRTTFNFVHAGASQLSEDKKRWLALDATMGVGAASCTIWYPCWTGVCYSTSTVPHIDDNFGLGGSGGAVAGRGGDYDSLSGYRGNPGTTYAFGGASALGQGLLRYGSEGPGDTLDGAGGLQDYYRDVANPGSAIPANQSPELNGGAAPVTIEVQRIADTMRTSSQILHDSNRLSLEDGMRGETMRALSSAHAYFYRPGNEAVTSFTRSGWRRGDGKTEVANQFNPYWQSRLIDRSADDRAASWTAQ